MINARYILPTVAVPVDQCFGCHAKNADYKIGEEEHPCFYCEAMGEDPDDDLNGYPNIDCLIEDAQDHGFRAVVHGEGHMRGLFILGACPECHNNAMMLFINESGRSAHGCTCGHKKWAQ